MKHKRLLSILLALVLVLSLLPVLPAFAAEYNLTIAGVKVTDTNKDDLAGGAMSYNPGSKTLTIKGDASCSSGILIENGIDGLTITTSGSTKCNLTTYSGDVIDSDGAALTIKDANLSMITYASNSDRSAIYMHNGSKALVFENADVYMNGGWTLCGQGGPLTVKESYLTIAAGERAVNGFSSISLSGCTLTKPVGGKYATGTIYEADGTTYAKNVTIARTYALKIAGVQVTDANKNDILGDGAFLLDTTNYSLPALYIKGDCNAGNNHVIDSELDYLTITVDDKDVTLTAASGSGKVGIRSTGTVLLGSNNNRKLTIDAPTGIYIKASANCNLLIGTMSLEVKNSAWGITGTADKVALSFYDAEVYVKSNTEAVSDFRSISFTDCELIKPVGGTWDTGTILNSNGVKATEVQIGKPSTVATYDLWVKGTQVTGDNQANILGDGSCRYDPDGHCLYLNKDIIMNASSNWPIIRSGLDTLTVRTDADIVIRRTEGNGEAVYATGNLWFCGSGKLMAISNGSTCDGIHAEGEITVNKGSVEGQGGQYGIRGKKITLTSATVAAKGSINAIRATEEGLHVSSDMGVIKPIGGQIFGSDIRNADGSVATEVLLAVVENYDLKVCGKQVNSANAPHILGDDTFAYDPATKTLTVNGSCEYMGVVIESRIDGLKINVTKDADLKAIDAHCILLYKNAAIGGTGKLTAHGLAAVYVAAGTLTIDSAKLDAIGSKYGIYSGGSGKLALANATVNAKGDTSAVEGFAEIKLSSCYIKTPEDGEVSGGKIVDKNGSVAKTVEIVPGVKPGTTTFTVTFNANGHGTAPAAQTVESGKTAVKPADPTAAGWKFGGWYKEAACTNAFDFATPITANITLYAKWTQTGGALVNPFVDVHEGDFFYDAVLWAYYHTPQITTGTNANHFSPGMACSRAQVVTFLWRAKGCPKPKTTEIPFTDVPAGTWYSEAVLWAVENNITTGTGGGKFSPNMACSRSQVVTFLWRTRGCPAPSSTTNPFSDVPAGQWFTDAVLWAVEKNITGGTGGGRFSPNMTCSRGQIVTFLYRDMAS